MVELWMDAKIHVETGKLALMRHAAIGFPIVLEGGQFELAEKVKLGLLPAAEGAEAEPQKVGRDFWRLSAFKWILRVRGWW